LGLAYFIQYHRFAWHDPVYAAKLNCLETQRRQSPDSEAIVVLGSSRVICGMHGKEVQEAFPPEHPVTVCNFGVTAGGPIMSRLHLERLLEQGIRPDVVVIEVLPALLTRGFEGVETLQYPVERYQLREHAYAVHWGVQPDRLTPVRLGSLLLPSYAHRIRMWQDIHPGWLPPHLRFEWTETADAWGTVPMAIPDEPPLELRRRALKAAREQYHPRVSTFVTSERGTSALHELLVRCREVDCRVVLLWMPEGKTFQTWYRPGAQEEFLEYLARLQCEFGCDLIDAQDWMPEEAFVDSHHLLKTPACAFSRRLGKELAAILHHSQIAETKGQAGQPTNR